MPRDTEVFEFVRYIRRDGMLTIPIAIRDLGKLKPGDLVKISIEKIVDKEKVAEQEVHA